MSLIENNKLRTDFPALTQKVRGKQLVYLDSAATTLKPWTVIERISSFYSYETANVHRGAHYLADMGTQNFELSRDKTKSLLNAASREEIIFTSGTTNSINLIARTWGKTNLKKGEAILISEMEHHANLVPWQMLCEEIGAQLLVVSVSDSGDINWKQYQEILERKSPAVKMVALTHCSNTLGTYVDIKKAARLAHQNGALIAVDGAQAIATLAVDVQALDVDFYSFSGHKMFGPYGTGVLYGKKELLEKMPPADGGGSMISTVSFRKTIYNDIPYRFEAGTPNIEGVIALGTAIDYVKKIGFEKIQAIEHELLSYARTELKKISNLQIFADVEHKAPIISFALGKRHHSDVAQILDQEGIAVRAGHHCTMPLLEKFGVTGTIRVSFSIYNNRSDIDQLVKGLSKAQELLS
jgi:cysteine desulfurase/selenocysteine lyase